MSSPAITENEDQLQFPLELSAESSSNPLSSVKGKLSLLPFALLALFTLKTQDSTRFFLQAMFSGFWSFTLAAIKGGFPLILQNCCIIQWLKVVCCEMAYCRETCWLGILCNGGNRNQGLWCVNIAVYYTIENHQCVLSTSHQVNLDWHISHQTTVKGFVNILMI